MIGKVYGHVYLDGATCCDFGPFEPPRFVEMETFTVRADKLYDVSIMFLDERHVKVMVPRDFVTRDGSRPVSDSAPEVFTFYGILMDIDERIAKTMALIKALGR